MPTYTVAFWNVENLFDIEDSPRRTDKLRRVLGNELAGWTPAILDRKVSQLASVITQFNSGNGPDILGMCEIENRYVLELLRDALTPLGRNYDIVHADTRDERGIDVAFIFDADKFVAQETFFHFIVKRVATRDIVQVNFRTAAGRRFVAVGNHWPSRSGGQLESEPFRIIAGETLAYFHQRIREVHGTDTPILAMGDFNDEPPDRSLSEYARSFRQRETVLGARTASLLNLMWPIMGSARGTHYYSNTANVLDQFLVSKSLLTGAAGLETGSADVFTPSEMVGDGVHPVPIRFGRGASLNQNGYSDHFPIVVQLTEA